jgi:poly-gamma-glutamate capsule biosynthesis protein CapA/YwtB (metallophosphatase superfamily)
MRYLLGDEILGGEIGKLPRRRSVPQGWHPVCLECVPTTGLVALPTARKLRLYTQDNGPSGAGRPAKVMFARESYRVLLYASLLAALPLFGADLFPEEPAFRLAFDASRVTLKGRVVDPAGRPLGACALGLDGGETGLTGADGTFTVGGLWRSNQLLTVTRVGYYRHVQPVQLFVPITQTNVVLPPLVLWPDTPSVVRFLFGGDTTFARRMLDPLERAARDQMPIENPDALIRVSDPLPGSLGAVNFVKPLFLAVDYPVVNFESVVTLDPSTPHWQKSFVYFSLPGSLGALRSLNIDYVSLGNNHTYDYLESGVTNTLRSLDEAGFHHSGLGTNSGAAFTPYRTSLKGTPYSFLAMTSIGGEQYATNYVASTNKGGAAYIEATAESRAAIASEKSAGNVTIVQTHVGDEYTFEPSASALNWMKLGVDAGADLLVAHHTHVAQGFGMYRGVLVLHCLGNLCFDQDRLETMVGLVATVDMEGNRLRRAWGAPVYLEDYRPRLMCGRAPAVVLRRIAEVSQQLRVFPYNGQAWVASRPSQYSFEDRRITVPVPVGANGWTVVDLRELAGAEESLGRVETDTPGLIVRPGRDIMTFGDFEDVDLDGERGEAARWDFGSSTMVTLQSPYRGTGALGIQRSSANLSDAVASFRNRARVMGDARNTPNKELSLFGYVRAQQAGRIQVVARYYASEGATEFGEETAFGSPGGTFPWQPFVQDLHLPPDDPSRSGDPSAVNARAIRVFLRHSPPATGAGYAYFDELALVSWEETLDPLTGPALDTPHARDFLRVQGLEGTYQLALTFRKYRPTEADAGHGPDLALETEQPDQSVDRLWFRPTSVGFEDVLRLAVHNRGDQALVVSNLAVLTGDRADFLPRWLTASGSPGPVLIVPPLAMARLEVRFVPHSAGPRQAVLQFQSNDPDDAQAVVTVALTGEGFTNTPVRLISGNRTSSPTIHLQVPAMVLPANLLHEQLPAGLNPLTISDGGRWDAASRTLQWQDVGPRTTLSYSVTGPSNLCFLSGGITAGGRFDPTAGDTQVLLFGPADADADGLPDWWELKFFDRRIGAVPEVDSDGDGRSNLAEFRAGTHPLDGGFQAQPWAPYLHPLGLDGQFAQMEVLGFEGSTYRLEASTNLCTWGLVRTNLSAGQLVVVPPPAPAGGFSIFYRAAVEER